MTVAVVFGQSGQVARSLAECHSPWDLRFFGRDAIGDDISASVAAILEKEKPAIVLNAAAYTLVDQAEKEQEAAYRVNADLPRAIIRSCTKHLIPLVHISTDYVFDGRKVGSYREDDRPNPLSVYGASKLAGDQAILDEAGAPFAILRTSWVFSHVGETFPRKILRRAHEQGTLRIVTDQTGCPTPSHDLAVAMIEIGKRLIDGDRTAHGLFNYCGDRAMSWFGFASELVTAAREFGLRECSIAGMLTEELNLPARRPSNSVLDCSLIERTCHIAQAPLREAIQEAARRIMEDLLSVA